MTASVAISNRVWRIRGRAMGRAFWAINVAAAFLFFGSAARESAGQSYDVTTVVGTGAGTLYFAIQQADAYGNGAMINMETPFATINLSQPLPDITVGLTINGAVGCTLSGQSENRIFFINAPGETVQISNLTFAGGLAQGGNGGMGAGSGGGGAGLGGAIFVNAGSAIFESVAFQGNAAVGGNGGGYSLGGGGGGGGLGFSGGNGGQTTIINGNPYFINGGGGGGARTSAGQNNSMVSAGNGGGVHGGAGALNFEDENFPNGSNATAPDGGGGGGGVEAHVPAGGAGGGAGGNGSDFGGGGGAGGSYLNNAGSGGNGGFGAGGGGGADAVSGSGGSGGNGGFGGGGGGAGGSPNVAEEGPFPGGSGGFGGGVGGQGNEGTGGGGGAFGGAVFVRSGASVTFVNSPFDAGSLTAGAGGTSPIGNSGGAGTAAGGSLFLMGGIVTFGVNAGTSQTVAGSIAQSTTSGISVIGGGTLVLSANNSLLGFSGGSSVSGGSTLSVAADNALGAAASGVSLSGGGTLQITGAGDNSTARSISLGTGGGAIDIDDAVNFFTVSQAITGGGGLTVTGPGFLVLTANNGYSGGTTINNGQLRLQNFGLPATSIVINSPGALVYDTSVGNINQLRSDLSGNGTLQLIGGKQLLFGNGGSNAINWNFSAGALIDIEGGTLVGGTSNMDNWSNDNAAMFIAQGAVFSGVEADVQIDALTGGGTFTGGYAFGGVETIGIANGSGLFSGSLQDTITADGYDLSLVKVGTGTETFSGTNTYSGGTTVNNGTLKTTSLGTIGAGPLVINAAGGITSVVNLGNNQTVSSLSGTVAAAGSATLDIAAGKTLIVNQSGGDTVFGGTLNIAGTLNKQGTSSLTIGGAPVYGASSMLEASGGTLTLDATAAPTIGSGVTATIFGGATLQLIGSISQLNQTVNIANDGTLSIGGSANQTVGTVTGAGGTTVSSGSSLTAYQIRQNSLTINGTGKVALAPSGSGSTSQPASPNNINFSSSLTSLSIAGTTNAWTGTLDIGNNGLVIAYGSGTDPYATIDNLIASGFDGGSWQGTGITSSLAAAAVTIGSSVPALNIGLVDFKPGTGSSTVPTFVVFEGQTVTTNAVLLRLTYMDDLLLTGDVMGADASSDALLFAANYGTATTWSVGDLTHDGQSTSNDSLLFAANYSTILPSLDGTTGNAAALLGGGGAAAVPEPSSIALGAAAALSLSWLARRRFAAMAGNTDVAV